MEPSASLSQSQILFWKFVESAANEGSRDRIELSSLMYSDLLDKRMIERHLGLENEFYRYDSMNPFSSAEFQKIIANIGAISVRIALG